LLNVDNVESSNVYTLEYRMSLTCFYFCRCW